MRQIGIFYLIDEREQSVLSAIKISQIPTYGQGNCTLFFMLI